LMRVDGGLIALLVLLTALLYLLSALFRATGDPILSLAAVPVALAAMFVSLYLLARIVVEAWTDSRTYC